MNQAAPCAPVIVIDERTKAYTISDITCRCVHWERRDPSDPGHTFSGGDWEPWTLPEFYMSDSPSSQCRCVVVGTRWRCSSSCPLHRERLRDVAEELEA